MFTIKRLLTVLIIAVFFSQIVAGDTADDLIRKGHTYESAGRYDEALALYNQAILIKPHESYVYLPKGDILEKLGYYEEAVQVWKEVMDNLPNSTEPIYYYHFVPGGSMMCAEYHSKGKDHLIYKENYDEALFYFHRVHELCPNDTDIENTYSDEGYALYKLGRFNESLKAYDTAIQLSEQKLASDPGRRDYSENNRIFKFNRQMVFTKMNPAPAPTAPLQSGLSASTSPTQALPEHTGNPDSGIPQGISFPWFFSFIGIGIGYLILNGKHPEK